MSYSPAAGSLASTTASGENTRGSIVNVNAPLTLAWGLHRRTESGEEVDTPHECRRRCPPPTSQPFAVTSPPAPGSTSHSLSPGRDRPGSPAYLRVPYLWCGHRLGANWTRPTWIGRYTTREYRLSYRRITIGVSLWELLQRWIITSVRSGALERTSQVSYLSEQPHSIQVCVNRNPASPPNSTSPSSRRMYMVQMTVFLFTPKTAARSVTMSRLVVGANIWSVVGLASSPLSLVSKGSCSTCIRLALLDLREALEMSRPRCGCCWL